MTGQFDPPDLQNLVKQLMAGASPAEGKALLDALMSGQVTSIFEKLNARSEPTLLPVPIATRGFRVRLDLHGAKPPIWRRLELPGDLPLPRIHDVIQSAMGWYDSHLHRFRTGNDHRSPYFITDFDLDEGEEGLLEDNVRLDQILAEKGDELWYEYDFGDGWDHKLVVEEVLGSAAGGGALHRRPDGLPARGLWRDSAATRRSWRLGPQWVRRRRCFPGVFEDAEHGHGWLPLDWHPDRFDLEETNAALAVAVAEPVAVTGELAELAEQLEHRGIRLLREVLGRPFSHGPTDVSEDEAARLTETYRIFLDLIGDGVPLTAAGYLKPALVEQIAERSGIGDLVDRQGEPRGHHLSRRRHPQHGAGPRTGQRPQGQARADGCRCALWSEPARALAPHRRTPPAGNQGRRTPSRVDGARRRRERNAARGVAQRDQRVAVRPRLAQRLRPVLVTAGQQ